MDHASGMDEVISRWETSGMSLRQFGTSEGISYPKLVYWRQKLRGARVGRKKKTSTTRQPAADLVAIHVVPEELPKPDPTTPFSVWLANGVGIDVPAGFDAGDLRRLVSLLASC